MLHKAPRVNELLPHSSLQPLSATCSFLHKWVRDKTTCVRIRHADDLSNLAPEDWPGLAGVLLNEAGLHEFRESRRLLQGEWKLDAQVCFGRDDRESVLLISVLDNLQHKHFALTPQQCEILPQCADRTREATTACGPVLAVSLGQR